MKFLKHFSFFLVLILGIYSFTKLNDFHTSTTKVEYNEGNTALTFTSKFVTEDLEKAVGVKVSNESSFNGAVETYLRNHFQVKVNGVSKSYNYLKAQTSPKATRIYFEIPSPGQITSIEILNSMLVNEFPEQQNFITFSIRDKRDSFVTKKGSVSGKINL